MTIKHKLHSQSQDQTLKLTSIMNLVFQGLKTLKREEVDMQQISIIIYKRIIFNVKLLTIKFLISKFHSAFFVIIFLQNNIILKICKVLFHLYSIQNGFSFKHGHLPYLFLYTSKKLLKINIMKNDYPHQLKPNVYQYKY